MSTPTPEPEPYLRITVTIRSDYGDHCRETVESRDCDEPDATDPEYLADVLADALLAHLYFRGWVPECLAHLVLYVAQHLTAERGRGDLPPGLAELAAAAWAVLAPPEGGGVSATVTAGGGGQGADGTPGVSPGQAP